MVWSARTAHCVLHPRDHQLRRRGARCNCAGQCEAQKVVSEDRATVHRHELELPIGYDKDGFHYGEDSTRLISRLIGQSSVRFLDRGGPPRLGKPKPLTRMLYKEGQLPVQHGHKRGDPKQGTGVMHHTQKRPVNKNQQRRKSGTNQHQMELVQLIA